MNTDKFNTEEFNEKQIDRYGYVKYIIHGNSNHGYSVQVMGKPYENIVSGNGRVRRQSTLRYKYPHSTEAEMQARIDTFMKGGKF